MIYGTDIGRMPSVTQKAWEGGIGDIVKELLGGGFRSRVEEGDGGRWSG